MVHAAGGAAYPDFFRFCRYYNFMVSYYLCFSAQLLRRGLVGLIVRQNLGYWKHMFSRRCLAELFVRQNLGY